MCDPNPSDTPGAQLTPAERQHVRPQRLLYPPPTGFPLLSSRLQFGRPQSHSASLMPHSDGPRYLSTLEEIRPSQTTRHRQKVSTRWWSHLSFQTTFTSTANGTAWFTIHMPNANSAARNYTQLETWRSLSPFARQTAAASFTIPSPDLVYLSNRLELRRLHSDTGSYSRQFKLTALDG